MNPALFVDWQLRRLGRSGTIAVAGSFVLVCALAWLTATNGERSETLARIDRTESRAKRDASRDLDVPAWRKRLAAEETRLPERRQLTPLVRSAVGSIESAGVTIDAFGTTSARVHNLPYELVSLETRLSGPAARTARAVTQVLALSPGWALESLVLERRPAGQVSVEATFSLLTREAQ